MRHDVFISGGTGYVGAALAPELLRRGYSVRTIARPASVRRVPQGVQLVIADALHAETFADAIGPASTFIHLTGTPHPAPWKGEQFRFVDQVSLEASLNAAERANVAHFVYVSVAHPAPLMRSYIAVRTECERLIRESGMCATILRPWYILGPGHRWPYLLVPFYAAAECFPRTRGGARRLGLVSLKEMTGALATAVDDPPGGAVRIWEVPTIRAAAKARAAAAAHSVA